MWALADKDLAMDRTMIRWARGPDPHRPPRPSPGGSEQLGDVGAATRTSLIECPATFCCKLNQ